MTLSEVTFPSAAPTSLIFIGGGHLAQALLEGMLGGSPWASQCRIAITARRSEQADALRFRFPSTLVTMNNNDPAIWEMELSPAPVEQSRAGSHVLFICTRPVDVAGVCRELAPTLAKIAIDLRPTVVTMCPGITIGQLQSWLPYGTAVVRTMPNTPVECGEGATGIFPSPDVGAHRVAPVSTALRITSPTIAVLEEESLLDVVAAISGSAPAHFYYVMEALIAVGEKHGLPPDMAKQLVAQSCLGAGQLARDTFAGVHELRTGVCVPGGSTEKAIAHLEESGLMGVIKTAVGRSLDANRLMKMVE